jgi:hypothetical protein
MPSTARSSARLRVSPSSPAFAAAYGKYPRCVCSAWIEDTLTMEPWRAARIPPTTERKHRNAALRSSAKNASHSADVIAPGSE